MRILLLGMGSRGDVQPLVALGQRLQRMGYAVSLAAPADLGHVVAGSGVDFEPLSFDLEAPLREGLGRDSLRGSARTQVREARLMRHVMAQTANALAADVARLVDRADAVVSGALTLDLVDALLTSEGRRARPAKPHLYAVFAPVWPSAHGDSVALALRPRATSWLNRAWSGTAGRVAFDLFRPAGDLVRKGKGLPRKHFRDYVAAAERTPTILAASPHVVPPAPDWPPALRQTGYWVRYDADGSPDRSRGRSLEPGLEAFLAAGDAPVFVGFGSMPTPDPAGVSRDVVSVLGRLSVRGVVSEGLAGLRVERSAEVLGIGPTPHDALFPRCAVVVHHGGAGTTAAAVRAGVPQVVVPHAADQPYWGRRMADLGVAPPPIARKDLTPARLERALEVALSPGARETAYALGERVRAEDGAGDAARLVDAYLTRRA
ncbi:glycosyltransferase [Terrabacter sp. C0L_2]|uniref:glycosyltransferase n=1 Tax=Terrabacter sp. C0L_2 TaxID=3108389 RepID=UPI002ED18305|nr:glycosyltransferase [Terrabacter sp. C0L_2]